MDIREFTKNNILILDGAMGTMLQNDGLKLGEKPEVFNITNPDAVKNIHREYLKAGSNMIITNTLGANTHKLEDTGYTTHEIISAAVKTAKDAAKDFDAYVGLDIGPIGELLEPMGTLSFDEAYGLFREQITAGAAAGADAVYIETMTDLYETKCAVLAAKENCNLPIFCTMSFEQNMHTFTGTSISSMALTLEGLGVDFIGINCSVGPAEMNAMVGELIKLTNLPIVIKPNAGMPKIVDGKTVFIVNADDFVTEMLKIVDLGANAIGGCCGTTPLFIEKLSNAVKGRAVSTRKHVDISAVCSSSKTVFIDRVRIIGERINPTGKKRLKTALKENDMDFIVNQAIGQIDAGADILDVNVGLPGVDERSVMVKVIKDLQSVVSAPLQIDSSDANVIEAGLRAYNGKAIVNSVNGDLESLEAILPIVKKYGAAVVGLTLDKNGIPRTAGERYEVAERIVNAALNFGISKSDIYIDCLTLTAGAEQEIAYEALNALSLIKKGLGVKTVLGVSNISFGLPARETLNQVFLSLALANGLDLPIINPNIRSMTDTVFCFHQLKNIDSGSQEYIKRFTDSMTEIKVAPVRQYDISYCVESGLKEDIKPIVKSLLTELDGLDIVNTMLIPALDVVGKKYESGKIFLPQLLQSAEAAKVAFDIIKERMPSGEKAFANKIILATVKGDIHDIGKNIVKAVLMNYGYDVIDLGKDVEISAIIDAAADNSVSLVGLSALMTTTVESMEKTIKELKKLNKNISVMVGGAVLTEQYAKQIGADFYAKDAMEAVSIAKKFFP